MRWPALVGFFAAAALSSIAQTGDAAGDLKLYDGRVFKSARIVAITEREVTIAHAGGVINVTADSVPLDDLARAYDRLATRREAQAKMTSELQERELRARRSATATDAANGGPQPTKARVRAKGAFALTPTGDDGPKKLLENACIVMTNAAGAGTGFILRQKDGFVLVSNQHVIDGRAPHKYEQAGGKDLRPLGGLLAKDRDLVVFDLAETFGSYFEMEPDINNVALGEAVVIYGNALGKGVRMSHATLLAKGKTQLEVSGGIAPGNSGGPILRAKTGKVIGVSTYATVRDRGPRTISEIVTQAALPKVQFYGVRIDTLGEVSEFALRAFLNDLYALEAEEKRLDRAVTLLVLLSQKLGQKSSSRMEEIAHNADFDVARAISLLKWSKFYAGTVNRVDLNAFHRAADGFFDPLFLPRSYIHARKRDQLAEYRAVLLDIYNQLLKQIPVR